MNESQISIWFISCSQLRPCEWSLSFPFVLLSSEDDAFLLYATLRSGKHCKFVTRDFLRDHKACLSDSVTRHLFRKWQRGHQIAFSPSAGGKHINFLVSLVLHSEGTQRMLTKWSIWLSKQKDFLLEHKKQICSSGLKTSIFTEDWLYSQSIFTKHESCQEVRNCHLKCL